MTNLMSAHRIEIQQGNFVSQETVSQLKPGMSKDQVRFVMGTPLITDSFHGDRWDYVFRRQKANSRELEQRKLTVFFEDGKLKRIRQALLALPGGHAALMGQARAAEKKLDEAVFAMRGLEAKASDEEIPPAAVPLWSRLSTIIYNQYATTSAPGKAPPA